MARLEAQKGGGLHKEPALEPSSTTDLPLFVEPHPSTTLQIESNTGISSWRDWIQIRFMHKRTHPPIDQLANSVPWSESRPEERASCPSHQTKPFRPFISLTGTTGLNHPTEKTSTQDQKSSTRDIGSNVAQPADWSKAQDIHLTNLANERISLASLIRQYPSQVNGEKLVPNNGDISAGHSAKKALRDRNMKLVFITCHTSLSEVKLFIKTFAFWLRTLPSTLSDHESSPSRSPGDGHLSPGRSHPLPGELFLDPERKAYAFFGIGEKMGVWSGLKELLLSSLRGTLGLTQLTKMPPVPLLLKRKRSVYTELTAYISLQMKELLDKAVIDSYLLQSPGIVVIQGHQVLYRWVSVDNRLIETGCLSEIANRVFGESCEVDFGGAQDMSDVLAQFATLLSDRESRRVPEDELCIGKKIGSGAICQVYEGKWMGQRVAIKYLNFSGSLFGSSSKENLTSGRRSVSSNTTSEGRRRQDTRYNNFANEVTMLMSLRHPNIVTLMGFGSSGQGDEEPALYMITELMAQGSLFDLLHSRASLSADQKRGFLLDIANGLFFLHHCKPIVIHKDLKSLNILISEEGVAKLADFEVASEVGSSDPFERRWDIVSKVDTVVASFESSSQTSSGVDGGLYGSVANDKAANMLAGLMEIQAHGGTYPWMSPEYIQHPERPLSAWDVFAFGVVAWEVATRRKPWFGCRRQYLIPRILQGERLEIPENGVPWPTDFCRLLRDCWREKASARPKMNRAMLRRLERMDIPC